MKTLWKKPFLLLCALLSSLIPNGQNTPSSCVISTPHNNTYFKENTDVTINVYSSNKGGAFTGGNVSYVEFFVDDIKLGETSTATSNIFTYVWTDAGAVSIPPGSHL